MDDLFDPGKTADIRIIDIALVPQDADCGTLAAGYGFGRQPHALNSVHDCLDLLVERLMMHDNQHGVASISFFTLLHSPSYCRRSVNHKLTDKKRRSEIHLVGPFFMPIHLNQPMGRIAGTFSLYARYSAPNVLSK